MTGGYVILEFGPLIQVVKASSRRASIALLRRARDYGGCHLRLPRIVSLLQRTSSCSTPERNDMNLQIRRVVTGHNADGRAVVKIDEICRNLISTRKGQQSCVVWSTDTAPANNDADEDASRRPVGTTLAGGTVFRIVRYDPGVAPRNHRTNSVDYAVVLAGEIDMELDGTTV